MEIQAKAKINLTLNIVGISNGFHDLESVVTEISICDKLTVTKSDIPQVDYVFSRPCEEQKDNTYKAMLNFNKTTGLGFGKVLVEKHIPQMAGLGGSSADAQGVIKALEQLYNAPKDRVWEAVVLSGSDCPCQYIGGTTLMQGRGEKVTKIDCKRKLYFVIVVADGGVSTKECFTLCDNQNQLEKTDNNLLIDYLSCKSDYMPTLKNALFISACSINPEILRAYNKLQTTNPIATNMSGSGSAVYGIYLDEQSQKQAYMSIKGLFNQVYIAQN